MGRGSGIYTPHHHPPPPAPQIPGTVRSYPRPLNQDGGGGGWGELVLHQLPPPTRGPLVHPAAGCGEPFALPQLWLASDFTLPCVLELPHSPNPQLTPSFKPACSWISCTVETSWLHHPNSLHPPPPAPCLITSSLLFQRVEADQTLLPHSGAWPRSLPSPQEHFFFSKTVLVQMFTSSGKASLIQIRSGALALRFCFS